jgi:FHA domain
MPAKLIVDSLLDQSREEFSFDKPRITIGRKPGNDLHFNRPEISGSHAAFLNENEEFFIVDLGSTNGTLLNGAQLAANAKYPISEQDVVTINPFKIRLEVKRDISATMMETPAGIREPKKGGTILDLSGKVGTGTDPGPINPVPSAEPAAPAADAPALETPAPQPPPPAVPSAPTTDSAPVPEAAEAVETKGGFMGVFLWVIIGGVFLLLALGLIFFLLLGV